jgi:hypothetical protein
MRNEGVVKMANARFLARIVMINVLLAAILKTYVSISAPL